MPGKHQPCTRTDEHNTRGVLAELLANAQAVMADENLSEDDQSVVEQAVAQLNAAMDGLTAQGASEPSDKPETTKQPEATQKPQITEKPDSVPQTGDSAHLMWYVAALAAAVSLLAGTAVAVRKHRS